MKLNEMRNAWMFSCILILSACIQKSEIIVIYDQSTGITERYETSGDSIRSGKSEKFNPDGQLISRQYYKDGILNGERTIYYPNGQEEVIEMYSNGNFDGPYFYYYKSGQLQLEGVYDQNIMVGNWKRYYENSQLMEVVHFENNEENGPFVEYHENGNLKAEGQYYHGDNEHGLLKLYDDSGELYRTMECDSGKCHTIWKRDVEE